MMIGSRFQIRRAVARLATSLLATVVVAFLLTSCIPAQPASLPLPTIAARAADLTPSPFPSRAPLPTPQPSSVPMTIAPTAAAPVAPSPTPVYHEVQTGDTAWTIAAHYGVSVDDLLGLNNLGENPVLTPGQRLLIPPSPVAGSAEEPGRFILYRVKPNETFIGIAAAFGIEPATLQAANPSIAPEKLQAGQEIRVPWDGIHVVAAGETLSGIATNYGISFEALVKANQNVLDVNSLHHIEAGWELLIPGDEGGEAIADCSPVSRGNGVITRTVKAGEGLYCLAQKYGVQIESLIYANQEIIGEGGLEPGIQLRIPPADGALYTVSTEDIELGMSLADIAMWYGVSGVIEAIVVDWQGNPVALPLHAGQRLFIPNADTLAGAFDGRRVAGIPDEPPPAAVVRPGDGDDGGDVAVIPEPPAGGGIPFGGTRALLWSSDYIEYSPGYCPYVSGSGWAGAGLLQWPVGSREIKEGRGFRPGHEGIDIVTPEGTPVYAAETGIVVWAGESAFGGGIIVILAHGNNWRTYYGHLSQASVACGQQVPRGALIGYSGKTDTTFAHLHFGVHYYGDAYDPLNYLP